MRIQEIENTAAGHLKSGPTSLDLMSTDDELEEDDI